MKDGIDGALAETLFAEINAIGLGDAGITRPSYGAEECIVHAILLERLFRLGLKPTRDHARNLHVRYCPEGTPDGPDVAFGSHLDTVPGGGRYDGTAGVVAGMLVLERAVRERTPPPHPLRLVVLRGEESAWFGKCYLGSSAMFGLLPETALQLPSRDRTHTLADAMRGVGSDMKAIRAGTSFDPKGLLRFLELHIEQGPVLETSDEPMAVVGSIRGNVRHLSCSVVGESGHSGTTPQSQRRDALLAAADFLHLAEDRAKLFAEQEHDLVFTCGILSTDPSVHAISAIPGRVTFSLEFRSEMDYTLLSFGAALRDVIADVQARRGVTISLGEPVTTAPVLLDTDTQRLLHRVAGRAVPTLPSGAGHDAAVFQAMGVPTGMIFVRNQAGSHNPNEGMRMDDFLKATELLWRAVIST